MADDRTVSPPIGQVERSAEGFSSEPLEDSSPDVSRRTAQEPVEQPARPPFVPVRPVTPSPQAPDTARPGASADDPSDMARKKRKTNTLLKWLILVAVGLFVASIGSVFLPSSSFSERDVVLELDGPDRATSGEEVVYTLRWQNNTKLELKDMSFRLFYPGDSIVLVDGRPTQPDSEGFTVDSLMPGESGEREITLFLVGDRGSIKTATVNLIFNAGSLRSAFEKEVRINTTITDLPVALNLTAPPTAVGGQSVTYIADVRNETEEVLTDLQLELTYPEGFTVRDVRPDPDAGTTRLWTIDELSPGEGHRFTVQGTLSGVEREAKTVTAILRRKVSDEYIDYVRTDALTLLSSPLLSVRMTVNGSRDHVAAAGDVLEYELTYRNNSNHNLIGLEMAVQLDGQMYDFEKLRAPAGSFDDSLNTVRFSASGVPDFAALPPGASGTVTFTAPLRSAFVGGTGTQAFFVKASARLSTSNVPTGIDGNEVVAQDVITTKLASQPTLGQVIRYASGNPEMTVGEETAFTVDWSLTNPGNELRDARVTATLQSGVVFGGATTDGITFDPNTRQLSWPVGTIPFGTGVGLPRITGQFTLSVTPASNQRGQDVPLLGNAVLEGTDSFTNLNVQSVVRSAGTQDVEGLEESRVQ